MAPGYNLVFVETDPKSDSDWNAANFRALI